MPLSQNTHPGPSTANGLVSVRTLAAPTRSEIEALAEIFDRYRVHYGEASDASRSACWLDKNLGTSRLRAFVVRIDDRNELGALQRARNPGMVPPKMADADDGEANAISH